MNSRIDAGNRRILSRPATLMTFAAILLATARTLAATANGWFGLSLSVEVESTNGAVLSATIKEVFPDSPASGQHLAPGDRVIEIEGQSVAGAKLQTLQSLIHRETGDALRFCLQRPSGDVYCVVLTAARGPER